MFSSLIESIRFIDMSRITKRSHWGGELNLLYGNIDFMGLIVTNKKSLTSVHSGEASGFKDLLHLQLKPFNSLDALQSWIFRALPGIQ